MIGNVFNKGLGMAGLLTAMGGAAMFLLAANEANAEEKTPIQFAVQTTAAPQDAPVRTAVYSESDRDHVKYQSVRWPGRGWYGGYRAYYGPRYYSYYPGPVVTYYPRPYTYVPRRAYYYPAPVYVPYSAYYYYGW